MAARRRELGKPIGHADAEIAGTFVDTTITQDTAEHTFSIIFNDSVPNVTYYIDGGLVATITTTLPAVGKRLFFTVSGFYTTTPISCGFASALIDSDF